MRMNEMINHNLGEQPISGIITRLGLSSQDLVAASTEQLTHKVIGKACKGRRLTTHMKAKVCRALNQASGNEYKITDLFDY